MIIIILYLDKFAMINNTNTNNNSNNNNSNDNNNNKNVITDSGSIQGLILLENPKNKGFYCKVVENRTQKLEIQFEVVLKLRTYSS